MTPSPLSTHASQRPSTLPHPYQSSILISPSLHPNRHLRRIGREQHQHARTHASPRNAGIGAGRIARGERARRLAGHETRRGADAGAGATGPHRAGNPHAVARLDHQHGIDPVVGGPPRRDVVLHQQGRGAEPDAGGGARVRGGPDPRQRDPAGLHGHALPRDPVRDGPRRPRRRPAAPQRRAPLGPHRQGRRHRPCRRLPRRRGRRLGHGHRLCR